MLKSLMISKVRIKILEKFMLNPNESLHIRGVVRDTGEEINAVRRELMSLRKSEFLTSKKDGNKILFTFNKEHPLYNELQTLFFKDSKMGRDIINQVKDLPGLEAMIISEPFLTGEYKNEHDIDMLFLGNLNMRSLKGALSEIERDLEKELRVSAMKKEDFEFAKKKKDPIISNLLSKPMLLACGTIRDLLE